MNIRKTLFFAFILMLTLAMAACGSKNPETPTADEGAMSDAEIAARNLDEAKRIIVTEKIYFAYDSSELTPEAKTILNRKAEALKEHPNLRVLIEGHCDERGTQEYNLGLGNRRAISVQKYLGILGVPETQLETISYGEEQPAVQGHGESAWAQNRRAEFKVVW